MKRTLTIALAITGLTTTALRAQEQAPPAHEGMADCPMMKSHAAEVDARGDDAMGFSHEKTTHHFRLTNDGGAIEVTANDAGDQTSRAQIRGHLGHIAQMFGAGNFSIPMLVHAQRPPGTEVMKQRKEQIRYAYEEMPNGGRVKITTEDPQALKAVHEFLRFQIEDHRTGDPTALSRN